MSGGGDHGAHGGGHGGVSLSGLETEIAKIFSDGESSDALYEHLAHLSEHDRAQLLVDLHTYRNVSPDHNAKSLAQSQQVYSELYTTATKHMEHKHHGHGRFGFHPEAAEGASDADRDLWAKHIVDVALAKYIEKTRGKNEAKAKFGHVYDEHGHETHGHDHEGHGEGDTKAREHLMDQEREQLVDMFLGGRGAYKKLIQKLKLSKNILQDLKNHDSDLYKLFANVANNSTDYAMRSHVVDRVLGETYENKPELIHQVAVPRLNEWGKAWGHEHGVNEKYITDLNDFTRVSKEYLAAPVSALKEAGKHGDEKYRWKPFKEEHAGGHAAAGGGHH